MKRLMIACVILLMACLPAIVSTPTIAVKDDGIPRDGTPAPTSTDPDFIATEILGRPTDTSVTVNVVLAVSMEIHYEYGTAPGAYTAQTVPQTAVAGTPLETLISGLQPRWRRLPGSPAAKQSRL
jgi:hypothetical protein